MAVNKVVYGGRTVIDLTNDNVTAAKMLSGTTAHDKSGAAITGNIPSQAAKTITPSTSRQTAVVSGVYTTGEVTVEAIQTEEKTVTENGTVTPSSGKYLSKVIVNVASGGGDEYFEGGHTELTLPTAIRLKDNCFKNDTEITSIKLLSATTIGISAFESSIVATVEMPSATTIGNYAFRYCRSLSSIVTPSVVTVGNGAFSSCSRLVNVTMPQAQTIGENAFAMSGVTNVSIPNVTIIGKGAFDETTSLTTIDMTNVRTIEDRAFDYSGIEEVTLPNINHLGAAFQDSSLITVIFGCTPTFIDEEAFLDAEVEDIYCPWARGAVAGAPWGAEDATIHYNYTG